MKKSAIVWLGITATLVILAVILFSSFISFSNREIELKNNFEQKISERTTFYNKMWKILSQKSQITLKNDSSFKDNVNMIMAGRKDAPQLFMKWVTESNPNANFNEVSALYKDLSRSSEAQSEGFLAEERYLQDIKLQHSNLIKKFPGSFYNFFLGRTEINYIPVISDQTDETMRTGKDNNVKLF